MYYNIPFTCKKLKSSIGPSRMKKFVKCVWDDLFSDYFLLSLIIAFPFACIARKGSGLADPAASPGFFYFILNYFETLSN